MRLGCLGPEGTFSQSALYDYAQKAGITEFEEVLYPSFAAAVEAVDKGECDRCIVPVENSIEGAVGATMDALAASENLYIIGELHVAVSQNLLANCPIDKIKTLYSHPQPVGQCAGFLKKQLPDVTVEFAQSTAAAAKQAAETPDSAVLGSERLAQLYGLNVLCTGVEDNGANTTRFLVLGRTPSGSEGKTSVVFSIEDKPGALYKILSVFYIFGVNMARIESRPAKTVIGEYLFFVDLEGSAHSADLQRALETVEYKATFFKNFGQYPEL